MNDEALKPRYRTVLDWGHYDWTWNFIAQYREFDVYHDTNDGTLCVMCTDASKSDGEYGWFYFNGTYYSGLGDRGVPDQLDSEAHTYFSNLHALLQ